MNSDGIESTADINTVRIDTNTNSTNAHAKYQTGNDLSIPYAKKKGIKKIKFFLNSYT